jgi:hypothetical protein
LKATITIFSDARQDGARAELKPVETVTEADADLAS